MSLPASIAAEIQKLSDIRLVNLYQIDATSLGGSIYYFTNTFDANIRLASLTSVGLLATATSVDNHALVTGDVVNIYDANTSEYNGAWPITVTGAKTFTYTMLTDPVDNAPYKFTCMRTVSITKFNGISYIPTAFEATGFEKSGQGALPTPKISISNVNKLIFSAVISLRDLTGATFTRIRTMRKFLDDGSAPDPTATMPYDVFKINRKSRMNKLEIEFELCSPFDQEGIQLPRRQFIKNSCSHRYRVFNATTGMLDYSKATCPYAGAAYFNEVDTAVGSASLDRCGKRLSSCKLRFPNPLALPFAGFPGLGNQTG